MGFVKKTELYEFHKFLNHFVWNRNYFEEIA